MTWILGALTVRGGAVSFRDFMELALYDPDHGYYAGAEPRYGRGGDYLTAPSASRWYAETFAALLGRLADLVGGPLAVVDVGSGDGSFLSGVLTAGGSRSVSHCWSVERGAEMRRVQRSRFADAAVTVVGEIGALPVLEGPTVVHASELYDAAPVHRVVQRADGLKELWVSAARDGLSWDERSAPDPLHVYLARHGVELEDGQLAEINLTAEAAHSKLVERLPGEALVVVVDYGYAARRLYDPRGRRSGSLACYTGHRLHRDPLAAPGEHDITAHVNLDDLRAAARGRLEEVALLPLAELLVRAGIAEVLADAGLDEAAELTADTVIARQEIKRLLDPDGMGSDLKALLQARGRLAEAVRAALGV
jgi:SAM-dependent MidA family methyltransferase